jgi:hypothetical protein
MSHDVSDRYAPPYATYPKARPTTAPTRTAITSFPESFIAAGTDSEPPAQGQGQERRGGVGRRGQSVRRVRTGAGSDSLLRTFSAPFLGALGGRELRSVWEIGSALRR